MPIVELGEQRVNLQFIIPKFCHCVVIFIDSLNYDIFHFCSLYSCRNRTS